MTFRLGTYRKIHKSSHFAWFIIIVVEVTFTIFSIENATDRAFIGVGHALLKIGSLWYKPVKKASPETHTTYSKWIDCLPSDGGIRFRFGTVTRGRGGKYTS